MKTVKIGSPEFIIGMKNYELDLEAPGHYARVLSALVTLPDSSDPQPVALKIMKSEHTRESGGTDKFVYYQTFAREARMLSKLQESRVPFITPLLGFGYMSVTGQILDTRFRDDPSYPPHESLASANVWLYSTKHEIKDYEERATEAFHDGWLPFLILEPVPRGDMSLLSLLKKRYIRSIPSIPEALAFLEQLAIWLTDVHKIGIAYSDYKPEHFYWNGQSMRVIDWNASKWLAPEFDPAMRNEDRVRAEIVKDVHDCIAGVIVPLLTGRSSIPMEGIRPAPGSFQTIYKRYDDVGEISFTDDEERLGEGLKTLLRNGLKREIESAVMLMEYLDKIKAEWIAQNDDKRARAYRLLSGAILAARAGQSQYIKALEELEKAMKLRHEDRFFVAEVSRLRQILREIYDQSFLL